jgi:membrane protease YdiL (CAAX protease family)
MNQNRQLIARNQLIYFLLVAYAISWAITVPLALQAQGIIFTHIPFSLHYLSGFGPLLAAIFVASLSGGKQGLKELLKGIYKWQLGIQWWLIALSPGLALLLVSAGMRVFQGEGLSLATLGVIDYFPSLGMGTSLFWILTFGLGEETGWRGFVLPRLQLRRSAMGATVMLWIFWSLWHLPLFFYIYTLSVLPGVLIGLLAGSIVFTWIYNSTKGSIMMTILFHGLFNYATACSACKAGPSGAVISTLVMIWAVLVVFIYKPATLSHQGKHTTPTMNSYSTDVQRFSTS